MFKLKIRIAHGLNTKLSICILIQGYPENLFGLSG